MIYAVYRYDTPQCTSELVDLEALQVIVKSNWQHTSLDKQWNLLNPNFMQTHHFHLKFYAANIILTYI